MYIPLSLCAGKPLLSPLDSTHKRPVGLSFDDNIVFSPNQAFKETGEMRCINAHMMSLLCNGDMYLLLVLQLAAFVLHIFRSLEGPQWMDAIGNL